MNLEEVQRARSSLVALHVSVGIVGPVKSKTLDDDFPQPTSHQIDTISHFRQLATSMSDREASSITAPNKIAFKATYTSPASTPFEYSIVVPAESKSEHLKALRSASTEMQARINDALSVRMQEDQLRNTSSGRQGAPRTAMDENMEEDHYGEEVVEEA